MKLLLLLSPLLFVLCFAQKLDLLPGWNLVGFSESVETTEILQDNTKTQAVFAFDANNKSWLSYTQNSQNSHTTKPHAGLWVYQNAVMKSIETVATDEREAIAKKYNVSSLRIANVGSLYAFYSDATDKYSHNILDNIKDSMRLMVIQNGEAVTYTLGAHLVYEDITPRLVDIDGDGVVEIITITTDTSKGAGISIYKWQDKQVTLHSTLRPIGTSYRWLNIAVIDDLDGDGVVEIAWVQTPHIGGILKIAKIQKGLLRVLDEDFYYSNHAIGQTNLCLSVLINEDSKKVFFLPNQSRDKIVGFSFDGKGLVKEKEINHAVDFSIPLQQQYEFTGVIAQPNCEL